MFKTSMKVLAGIPMTVAGGICLLASLLLSVNGISPLIDPAWLTVIICGLPLLYEAVWRIIFSPGISKISSSLLITIAMIAAITIGDLFAAGEVAFIMAIGAILEEKTTDRAKKGLKKLIGLAPQQGRRIVDGKEKMISAADICVGDVIRVLPGETVPVDGEIISGNTSVDQSVMTGESLPVDKEPGDSMFCGTMNRFGAVDIRATKVGEDSSLQTLIRMVREAEDKKAPVQSIADKFASWMVPAALLIAIITFAVTQDIVRAVAVMVVFCPCALVLATPTAIMAAVGQATKHGVIIKSGEALQKMRYIDTVTFDKTGTLTYGRLEVSDVVVFSADIDRQKAIMLTASAEAKSEHPLGKAIVAYAGKQDIDLEPSAEFNMETGRGISAQIERHMLLCGSDRYLAEHGILLSDEVLQVMEQFRRQGKASVLTACDGRCVCAISLSDVLRSEAAQMVTRLDGMGTQAVLLTGDNREAATYFAAQANITQVQADLLPEQKVAAIARLQEQGHNVCMIGDGVNDSPALKTADVGVAMGGMGSDIAVDAADVALMSDDISRLPYLKRLSCATMNTIKVSITIAMTINMIALLLSVLGMMEPTVGALVHNAGSCLVVLLAALLYDRKLDVDHVCVRRQRKRVGRARTPIQGNRKAPA